MCTNLNIYAKPFFLEIHIHTPANIQTNKHSKPHNYLKTHTHTVVTVMIYEHWGFDGKQINEIRINWWSKVTNHVQWQCHYDHLCQGHHPNILDQLLQSITASPDRKLGHVIRTSWVITFIQNPYQSFRLSNYLLKFREAKIHKYIPHRVLSVNISQDAQFGV